MGTMFAVIFEVKPTEAGKEKYLELAAKLRNFLEERPGFISIERFQSLIKEGEILSLSFWKDEESIETWRKMMEHRSAQKGGKGSLFESYRIRVAKVVRDYTNINRDNAPEDSKTTFA